jgi:hypothetical protein
MGANLARSPPFDCDGGPGGICDRPLRRFTAMFLGDPMTTFDDRERGFEKRFALDQEQEFKAAARRNRALGEWAAGLMGLTDKHVAEYAQAVVKSDLEQPGEDDVLRKVFEDLKGSGVQISEGEVMRKMAELLAQAREAVREGK